MEVTRGELGEVVDVRCWVELEIHVDLYRSLADRC